jgi:hypothetical protein
MTDLISHEPATGRELWRAPIGDADAEVAAARWTNGSRSCAASPSWSVSRKRLSPT